MSVETVGVTTVVRRDVMKNELAAVKVVVIVVATSEKMAEMVVGLKLADVNEKLQAYETFLWFVDDCSYEMQFEKE